MSIVQIWVDADACPNVIKEILFRAAERARIPVTLVANQWLRTPASRFVLRPALPYASPSRRTCRSALTIPQTRPWVQ